MTGRNFQLTKIRSGDWLLPSNDAKVLWRLMHADGEWQLYRRPMFASDEELQAWDPDVLDDFEMWPFAYPTRQAAIDAAMEHDASVDGMLPPREYDVVDGMLVPKS